MSRPLLCAACLSLCAALGNATSGRDGVARWLERRRAGAELPGKQLSALGPAAVREIVGLCSGRTADLGPLAPEERELLLAALRSWPEKPVLAALVDSLPSAPTLDDRLVALRLIGAVGGRLAVGALDSLCAGLTADEAAHPLWTAELERTLLSALRRDDATFLELRRRCDRGELRSEIQVPAARALGAAGLGHGLAALEALLRRRPGLEREVLEALGRLRPYDDPPASAAAARVVRSFLSSPDPLLRRQAALSAGSLADTDAVPELVLLLGDADRRVQRGAHEALGRIAGVRLTLDAARWSRWHEDELDWFELEGSALVADLASSEPARCLAALRLLSSHPWSGRQVVDEIRPLLAHGDALIAVAACSALVKLDDVGAFGPLLEALEDERETVRAAAGHGLTLLTGVALEPKADTWQGWLEPPRS